MQREIKFRGKRVDNSEWVYGYLIECGVSGKAYIFPNGWDVDESDRVGHEGCLRLITFEVIAETVGQYTGLKDKNGKEIYEGDIVRVEEGEIFTVKYGEHNTSKWNDNWELGFYVESNSEEEISRDIRTDIIFWVKYRKLEVIGNIYEKPELLEVSK